MTGDTLK